MPRSHTASNAADANRATAGSERTSQHWLGPVAVPGEMVEQNGLTVEHPTIVSGQGDVRRLAPGQPANSLPGMHVDHGAGVLVPDVISDRFGDDTGATDRHASGCRAANQFNPRRPVCGRRIYVALPRALPVPEDLRPAQRTGLAGAGPEVSSPARAPKAHRNLSALADTPSAGSDTRSASVPSATAADRRSAALPVAADRRTPRKTIRHSAANGFAVRPTGPGVVSAQPVVLQECCLSAPSNPPHRPVC